MSVGLAFMVGPLAGSTVIKSYDGAVKAAVLFAIASGFFVAKLPKANKSGDFDASRRRSGNENSSSSNNNDDQHQHHPNGGEKSSSPGEGGLLGFLDVKSARSPGALLIMFVRCCMALAFHVFQTIWTASLKDRFGFGPSDHGKFMSFVGFSYALAQGFVAKKVTNLAAGNDGNGGRRVLLIQACCVVLGVGRYVAFHAESLVAVYVVFAAIVTSLGILNTILSADASNIAPSSEIGGLFGILEAVQSAAGMVGPVLGGALSLVKAVDNASLWFVVLLYALVLLVVSFRYDELILSHGVGRKQRQRGKGGGEEVASEMKNLREKNE